ncbi:MAG: DUF2171 domain-containing protein [Actinobacteria bacterium]|nr:MAG: DUF2171 domain-containing protein [Actinomycetota bacterium]
MGRRWRMEGYEVVTSDGRNVGRVAEVRGENVIVEHGLLRKKRHAIPSAFVHTDDDERVVRLTVSRELVESSPVVEDRPDAKAIAEHYGLAAGERAPETHGDGELLPDDPARSAEQEELRTGVEPAAAQRARIREGKSEAGVRGRQIIPSDPHEGP